MQFLQLWEGSQYVFYLFFLRNNILFLEIVYSYKRLWNRYISFEIVIVLFVYYVIKIVNILFLQKVKVEKSEQYFDMI